MVRHICAKFLVRQSPTSAVRCQLHGRRVGHQISPPLVRSMSLARPSAGRPTGQIAQVGEITSPPPPFPLPPPPLAEPVDWVGNAWGGHIGIRLATADRPRLRTLTTIGTPVQGSRSGRSGPGLPLVDTLPAGRADRFMMNSSSDSLLGAESIAAQPDQAATIKDSFREADRKGMFHAMRSMMLHRNGIEDLLPGIRCPRW